MEKTVNKIGAGLDMTAASLMMVAILPLANHLPMLSVFFFIGSLFLWNDILREEVRDE